jgi:hypothetical protein
MAQGLTFKVVNEKSPGNGPRDVVYVGSDTAANILTLTITNTSDGPLAIKGGQPVRESPDDGPASLYLDLTALLPADAIAKCEVSASDWNNAPWHQHWFDEDQRWAFTPNKGGNFPDGKSVTITIANFAIAGPPRSTPVTVGVDYYRFGTLDDEIGTAPVQMMNPPGSKADLKQRLTCGFLTTAVAGITQFENARIENRLLFYFGSSDKDHKLVEDAAPRTGTPEFIVSFLLGDPPGYAALTTLKQAADKLDIKCAETGETKWEVTKDTDGGTPVWHIKPLSPEVLGTGSNVNVVFEVTGLVTVLEPGLTPMYIRYVNIPGYEDGYFALEIEKRYIKSGIVSFDKVAPISDSPAAGEPVQLLWRTVNVPGLQLTYTIDDQNYVRRTPDIELNQTYAPQPLPTEPTTYFLHVLDERGNVQPDHQETVEIKVRPRAPTKNRFDIIPNPVLFQDGEAEVIAEVTVAWDVSDAIELKLVNTGTDTGEIDLQAKLPRAVGERKKVKVAEPRPGETARTLVLRATGRDNRQVEWPLPLNDADVLSDRRSFPAEATLQAGQGYLTPSGGFITGLVVAEAGEVSTFAINVFPPPAGTITTGTKVNGSATYAFGSLFAPVYKDRACKIFQRPINSTPTVNAVYQPFDADFGPCEFSPAPDTTVVAPADGLLVLSAISSFGNPPAGGHLMAYQGAPGAGGKAENVYAAASMESDPQRHSVAGLCMPIKRTTAYRYIFQSTAGTGLVNPSWIPLSPVSLHRFGSADLLELDQPLQARRNGIVFGYISAADGALGHLLGKVWKQRDVLWGGLPPRAATTVDMTSGRQLKYNFLAFTVATGEWLVLETQFLGQVTAIIRFMPVRKLAARPQV